MKKILSTIIIFCLIATSTSYAQLFNGKSGNGDSSENTAIYDNAVNSGNETNDDYGGFFRSSTADSPGGRPGNGDAIGQEAPLKDGFLFLVGCCFLWFVVKSFNEKRKKTMFYVI